MEILKMIQHNKDIKIAQSVAKKTVRQAEEKLGLRFSNQYREYILKCGTITFNGHEITGISEVAWTNVVNVTLEQRELHPHIPKDWYVVEEAHIDDIIFWQAESGVIYQTSFSSDPIKICDSFEAYLLKIGIGSPKETSENN